MSVNKIMALDLLRSLSSAGPAAKYASPRNSPFGSPGRTEPEVQRSQKLKLMSEDVRKEETAWKAPGLLVFTVVCIYRQITINKEVFNLSKLYPRTCDMT